MVLTFNGRLPGVVCEAALPAAQENPLQLDVAAFVGFAERGPLDQPIAVEDISQYRAVFGGDLLLARQERGGQPVYANLPQAVRAFFDNGGRRCYVVRVAGQNARPNRFRLPGLVAWNKDEATYQAVIAPAAWVGRWSDSMSIGTQLRSLPLHIDTTMTPLAWKDDGSIELHLEVPTQTIVRPNDLLRLQFKGKDKPIVLCSVDSVERTCDAAATRRGIPMTVKAGQDKLFTFVQAMDDQQSVPLQVQPQVERLTETGGWEDIASPITPLEVHNEEWILYLPTTEQVQEGDFLRAIWDSDQVLLFPVAAVGLHQASPSEPTNLRVVSRTPLWPRSQLSDPSNIDRALLEVDLLSFDLVIREGPETQEVWGELRFGEGSNYWIDTLVPQSTPATSQPDYLSPRQGPRIPGLDATRSSRLRVPLTDGAKTALYLPLDMDELPGPEEFARPLPDETNPLCSLASKDGLEQFDPRTLFLDPRLADVGVRDLLNEANQLLYLNPATEVEPLSKLHSLLLIDEIGLIALPDLVHRRWECVGPETEIAKPSSPPEPDWSHFQLCEAPPAPTPPPGIICDETVALILPPPAVELPDPRQQLNLLPVLEVSERYTIAELEELLKVQRALISFCAARADVVAVLSLPQHFQRRDVLEWQRRLTTTSNFLDGPTLSYAGVYHPWLLSPEELTPELGPLRASAPDGAVCGMMAARELARGPWIAPANVPLLGTVGLTPTLSTANWVDLFNAQVNIVRQRPGQFTLLSAHTLSADSQFLQISVRRLLIYLRKLALQRGMRYVFETNNERFRQLVQHSFEYTLTVLTERGALNDFEVVTGSEINTPNDFDNGRFLIALKVAPTQPIEFITVVLLRAGEGLLEVIER
jgi:Phage tail sheath C-terminal domain